MMLSKMTAQTIQLEGRFSGTRTESSSGARLIGVFPGLGSRAAYRGMADELMQGASHRALDLLDAAAAASRDSLSPAELLLDGDLPSDRLRRQGRIGAGVLAMNLLLAQRFADAADGQRVSYTFVGFTGESFGVLSAAVASGALTVGDGIRIAEAFTPLMLLGSASDAMAADHDDEFLAELRSHLPRFAPGSFPVEEPEHVIGLVGEPEHLSELLLEMTFSIPGRDVEVHKRYSWRQVNVYVRSAYMPRFTKWLDRFPLIEARELKEPTTFCAHSERMHVVRDALSSWMAEQHIAFHDPHTPVIANHRQATLTSAEEVRDAVLAMTDRIMDSEGTAKEIMHSGPDMVLELGPGNRSLELLEANGVGIPDAAWTRDDTNVLRAVDLADRLRSTLTKLRKPKTTTDSSDLELLRDVFSHPVDSVQLQCARRIVGDAITDLVNRPRRADEAGLRRFVDLFQHTLAHREDIDLAGGQLVARARVKKRLDGDVTTIGHATTELEVLRPDGTTILISLDKSTHAEAIVFHFEKPADARPAEIIRATRDLNRAQPAAERIGTDLMAATRDPGAAGLGVVNVQVAVAFVTHRLAMFDLLRTYRPSLIAQTDHNLAGSDRLGWLVSLAAAGSVPPASIVPLVALSFDQDVDPARMSDQLDKLVPEIGDATIPVLSPEGVPLRTGRELRKATVQVFRDAALDRAERLVQLNGACLVLSLGSVLPPYRVQSIRHQTQVVSVRVPAELWRKGLNRALDAADEQAILVRSHEREQVVRYARERKLLSSAVNAYIEPGETLVGFGAGGSESMTMFIERDGESQVQVRKVLSDALTTALWDPDGTGTMLPPFAKAQRQAEYLQALPEHLRQRFPRVGRAAARELPVPSHQPDRRSDRFREFMYEMSYVPGVEVGRWVERFSPPPAVIARVYEVIMSVLHQDVHSVGRQLAPGGTLEEQYFSKIEQRLDLCRVTAPTTFGSWLLDTDRIMVNGRTLRNIRPLLAAFRSNAAYQRILEPRFHSLVMGDTNTENIKIADIQPLRTAQNAIESGATTSEIALALQAITAESIGLQFLDPRAIGYRSSGAETRDDPMYDNKPWHNSIGHYDEIHNEHFDLNVDVVDGMPAINVSFFPDNPYQRSYRVSDVLERLDPSEHAGGMEAYFAPVMRSVYRLDDPDAAQHFDDPHWLTRFVFTMGTHFTAMPPFHFLSEIDGSLTDSPLSQRRPVAIYAEGIKWLNWANEMLEGTRSEFLGIPLPPATLLRTEGVSQ